MSTPIKIKADELAEVKMLQSKFQESIYRLGNLQIEKMELDRRVNEFVDREKKLKDEWVSLQKLEESLLDKIVKNYGEGNLNMVDGTFTPTLLENIAK
jgi:predicted nuclease with TOPRIM domain